MKMSAFVAAAFAVVSSSLFGGVRAVEYRWTGAEDAKWKNAANWTDANGDTVSTYPGENAGSADAAMFIIKEAKQAFTVDIGDGVSVDSIFITTIDNTYFDNNGTETDYSQLIPLGSGTVTFSGTGALTLTHPGADSAPTVLSTLFAVGTFISSQKAIFNVPVNFHPSDGYCAGVNIFNADFKEDVDFVGRIIWIKSGWLYPIYAQAVSGHSWQRSQSGEVHFRKQFTHTRSQQYAAEWIGDTGDPSGPVHFHGKVTAPAYFGTGSQAAASGIWLLYSPENEIKKIINGWVGVTSAKGENVFGGAVLSSTYSVTSVQNFLDGINLHGFNQVADRVDGVPGSARDYATLTQNYVIRSVSTDNGRGALDFNNPATLTLNGSNNATTEMAVMDAVSLVWNPSDKDYVQTFRNRRHLTSGTITVQNGTFKISGATTWENVPELTIAGTATFDASTVTGEANPMASLKRVMIAGGGKIVTGASAPSIETAVLRYDGTYVANGTYAAEEGDGVIAAPWIEGDGTVVVNGLKDKTLAVWVAKGDGDFEDGENWSCGESPLGSETVKDVILDGGSGKTVTLNSTFSTSGFNLTIGAGYVFKVAEGASFTFAQDKSDATLYKVTVLSGGTWTNAGTVAFSNYRGECSVRAEGVLTTSGSFTFTPKDSNAYKFLVEGSFIATAGDVAFPGPSLKVVDGAVFDIGDVAFTFDGTTSNELLFDGGTVTFEGETLIGKYKPATALTFKPAADNTLTVNFKDHAGFYTASDGRDIRFMGGTAGGKTVLNFEAQPDYSVEGDNYKTVEWLIGCGAGAVEATVAACCTQTAHAAGLKIGTPLTAADTTVPVTANMTIYGVSISGGTLETAWGADAAPIGVIVGYGLGIGAATTVTEGQPYQGNVTVNGGILRANNGTSVIGAGYGKGTVTVVNGGMFDAPLSTYNEKYARLDGVHDNDGYAPCVIGMNGGEGLVTVSGEGSLYRALQGKTYIGGIARDQVPIFVRDYTVSPARLFYRSWNPADGCWVEALAGTAQGKLLVDGGKLQLDRGLELGADGTGVLEVVGSDSTVKITGDLVLKDATDEGGAAKAGASILRWTAKADGQFSPITLADSSSLSNRFVITSGAKVELDLGAATKKRRSYKLIATTRPLSEDSVALEDVPVEVVRAPEGKIIVGAGLERRDDGIYAWVRGGNGSTIIVR